MGKFADKFRAMSVAKKLPLLFLVFGAVPMAVLGVISFRSIKEMEDTTGGRFQTAAENIADKIDRNLFERYGDVQAFGFNEIVKDRDSWYGGGSDNALVRRMDQYVDTYDLYYLTIFVDLRGRVIAVNSKDHNGQPIDTKAIYKSNYKDSEWFKAVSKGEFTTKMAFTAEGNDVSTGTYIEDFHVDEDAKKAYGDDGLTIGFSAPVFEDGEVIGYWTNRAKFSAVEAIVQTAYQESKAAGYPRATFTILDRDGRTLMDYSPSSTGKDEVVHDMEQIGKLNLAKGGMASARAAVEGKSGFKWDKRPSGKEELAVGHTHLKGAMGYPGMNWSVLVQAPKSDVQAAAGTAAGRRNVLVTITLCLVATAALGWWIGRSFSVPLRQIANAGKGLALGDAEQEVSVVRHDEIGQVADSFREIIAYQREMAANADAVAQGDLTTEIAPKGERDLLGNAFASMVDSLRNLVGAVTGKAGELLETSSKLSDASTATASAAEEIGASILEVSNATDESAQTSQQIAAGSEQLALNATDAASSMNSLERAIDQVMAGSTEQQTASSEAFNVSKDGSKALSDTIGSMEKIERQVSLSAEVVKELGEKQQEIGAIVQTINEIAEQTNLLALNAAIEAARAGEQGRGFAVVADEVRKLAERSSTATREIADLIEGVRAGVDTAIKSMNESADQVSQGAAHSSAAREALDKILESIGSVQAIARRNDELVQDMALNAKSVSSAVASVASISEETAACAQEMSASNEEVSASAQQVSQAVNHQTATVQQVDAMARELKATADELQSLVKRFRLEATDVLRLREAA